MTERDPESEYGGLIRYWTDDESPAIKQNTSGWITLSSDSADRLSILAEQSAVINSAFAQQTRARRGFIRSAGVVALRILKPVYRSVWPWR